MFSMSKKKTFCDTEIFEKQRSTAMNQLRCEQADCFYAKGSVRCRYHCHVCTVKSHHQELVSLAQHIVKLLTWLGLNVKKKKKLKKKSAYQTSSLIDTYLFFLIHLKTKRSKPQADFTEVMCWTIYCQATCRVLKDFPAWYEPGC